MFKCVEELQYEINDLKRRLSFALNENQMLKVKYRKLETATKKKDKKIQYLMNPRKNFEMRKIVTENGTNIILNLQKRNKELEEIIAQKDAMNRKYQNEAKTTRLYSCHVQFEGSRKGGQPVSPVRSKSPLSPNVAVSTTNLTITGSSRTSSPDHSSWSITNGKNGKANDPNNNRIPLSNGTKVARDPFLRSIFTSRNRKVECNEYQDPEKLLTIIWNLREVVESLRQQKSDARKALRLKNLELERLAAELKAIRFSLKSQSQTSSNNNLRSNLADSLLQESKCAPSSSLASKSSNSRQCVKPSKPEIARQNRHCINNRLSQKRRSVPHNALSYDRNIKLERQRSSKIFEARQTSLEAVTEQSEDIVADIAPEREYRIICKKNVQDSLRPINQPTTDVQSKPGHRKTEIQYSIDSEVSSDGEEVYVVPNVHCQKTLSSS